MRRTTPRVTAMLCLALSIVAAGRWSPAPSAQAPAAVTALSGARVIDGTGRAPLENATIVVANGKIQDIGTAVNVPAGAARVDVRGKTIIPGLINAHGHVDAARTSTEPVRDQLLAQLRIYAQYGITTTYSLGSGPNDAAEGLKLRDEQEHTTLDRARLYSAGPVIADTTPEAARASVNRNADLKADIIKIRVDGEDSNPNKMKPEIYRAVIDEAHKRGLRVASHLYYLKDAMGLLEAGTDVIAHSVRDQDVTPAFISAVKARNVDYIPTLTRDLSVFVYESTPAFFSDPFFLRGKSLYGRQMTQLSDPAQQEKTRNSQEAQDDQEGARAGKPQLENPVGCRRGNRDGHRHGREPDRPLAGLLRARGARDDGEGGYDADAGSHRRDERRREGDEAGRRPRDPSAREVRRLRGADREPADRHQEHAADRFGLDRRPAPARRRHIHPVSRAAHLDRRGPGGLRTPHLLVPGSGSSRPRYGVNDAV